MGDGLLIVDSQSLVRESLPRRFEVAVAMKFPSVRNHHFLTVSLSNEKIFGEAGLYYKAGVEIIPHNYFALRFGYHVGPDIQTPRYGIGIKTNSFRVDYALAPSVRSLRFQQITLSLIL